MKIFFKKTKGFTLIELVLVVAILSILSVMVIFAINPLAQFQKANDAKVKSDLAQIQRALEIYYDDNGSYPPSTGAPNFEIFNPAKNQAIAWGTSSGSGGSFAPYMNFLPVPPGSSKYIYFTQNGQEYFLYGNLERGVSDPQICKNLDSNGECPYVPGLNLCGGKCNFGLSSPNVNP